MTEERIIESYMFACSNGANIIVEAEEKSKAIQIFESDFTMLFHGDWKIFKITRRVNINGEYLYY